MEIGLKIKRDFRYLHIVQVIVSSRKTLELLQNRQVLDLINVVVTDIQDTKRFLCNEERRVQIHR